MTDVFKLIEANGLTLHGDIEHFAELVRADEREAAKELRRLHEENMLEALKAIRDNTFFDADGPELRAQNECNHRRAIAAIAKAEGGAA